MIVIAAAGLSSRFQAAGYARPKFMLPLGPQTVFDAVLDGYSGYFASEAFLVAARPEQGAANFIESRLKAHGVKKYHVTRLPAASGMMPDVHAALKQSPFDLKQPAVITVADVLRPGFTWPEETSPRLFVADFGLKWGHTLPERPGFLAAVKHGEGLGCYTISNAQDFVDAFGQSRAPFFKTYFNEKSMEIAEGTGTVLRLRARGYRIVPRIVPTICYVNIGTPERYERLNLV